MLFSPLRLAYDSRLNSLERVVKKYDRYVKSVNEENRRLKEEVRFCDERSAK